MAIHILGYGYLRTVPHCEGTSEVPIGGNRLFHQMDRGKGTCKNHHRENLEVHMEVTNM